MSIDPTENPLDLFNTWFEEAQRNEPDNPNAMSLATVGPDGAPSIRMVLLKGVDDGGFVFYTNLESRKGVDLLARGGAALCFHWKSLRRQIRIEGQANLVSDGEADAYFASRPRGSQLGAWASKQSETLDARETFEHRMAQVDQEFEGRAVPRPARWGGLRVRPGKIEFWYGADFRLHERYLYECDRAGEWSKRMLYP
jgi:pyridoxamine 5'-phosphate oxidase